MRSSVIRAALIGSIALALAVGQFALAGLWSGPETEAGQPSGGYDPPPLLPGELVDERDESSASNHSSTSESMPVESPKPSIEHAGASSPTTATTNVTTSSAPKQTTTSKPRPSTSATAPTTTTSAPPVGNGVRIAPGESIQGFVNSHPAGTTFIIGQGVHRRQEVSPKDGNRFIGESGAVLDGENVAKHAFAASGVRDVVIERLVIKNYANSTQTGAIERGSSWAIRNNEVSYNKGGGVRAGSGWLIEGNYIHHNGQIGLLGHGSNIKVIGNEIAYNNTDGHNPQWEAGGTKFHGQATSNLVVKNNNVHNNNGPGLWTDYAANGSVIEGNTTRNNAGPGILHEISGSAVIRGNRVEGNGDGPTYKAWIDGAGIVVNSSRDVVISGNQLANNNDGIGLIESGRSPNLRNISVQGNTVHLRSGGLNGAVSVNNNGVGNMGAWGITFEENRYSGGGGDNFAWGGSYVSWAEWNALGFDLGGSLG